MECKFCQEHINEDSLFCPFCGNALPNDCGNGKQGFKNIEGEVLVPCIYDEIGRLLNGMSLVKRDGRYGFLNAKGKETVPCIYDKAYQFRECGLANVYKDGKCGLVDTEGNLVVPLSDYDYILAKTEKFYEITKSRLKGVYKSGVGEILPCDYDKTEWFIDDGYIFVKKDGLYGLINLDGKLKVPCSYRCLSPTRIVNGLFYVKCNAHYWGLIDENNREILRCVYDKIDVLNNNLISVEINGMSGFIDLSEEILPHNSVIFCDMIARGNKDGEAFFIDDAGNVYSNRMSQCRGFSVGEREEWFFGDVLVVRKSLSYAVYDKMGRAIVPFDKYGYIDFFYKGLARVRANSENPTIVNLNGRAIRLLDNIDDCKWGIINMLGKEVLPAEYDRIWRFSGKVFPTIIAEKDGTIKHIPYEDLNHNL